jgi:hypothetical protein
MMPFTLPENLKIVEAITPSVGAAVSGDYISCKNAHKVWIACSIQQAAANTITIGLTENTTVGTGVPAVVTATVPIWSNLDCATSDTLVRRTDAATYTTDSGVKHKIVIMEWDPANHTAGYDCIMVTEGASAAANIFSAVYLIAERYPQPTPPASISD